MRETKILVPPDLSTLTKFQQKCLSNIKEKGDDKLGSLVNKLMDSEFFMAFEEFLNDIGTTQDVYGAFSSFS